MAKVTTRSVEAASSSGSKVGMALTGSGEAEPELEARSGVDSVEGCEFWFCDDMT